MRKLLAFLLVASMLATVALCAFAVSAEEPVNIAEGKKYVTSPLHRQGGKEVNWAWDENAPITYEDTNGVELTDGILPADVSYQDAAFFGFSHSTPGYEDRGNYSYIRVDLEKVYDLGLLKLYLGSAALKNGISVSGLTVTYYKVDDMDGTNPVEIGVVSDIEDEDPEDTDAKGYVCAELEVEASARYLEIRLTRGGWVFVTEFEAFAAGESTDTPDEPKEPEVVTETVEIDADLTDTGWVKAEWIDNSFWQGVQEGEYPGDDITGKYTVRTDAENIYIAFEMNTIAPNTTEAYDANSFVQSSASNIRIWFKKDVETRTFFDIQYNGTEFVLANWNTTNDAPSENTKYKAVYADGKLTAEIAVNMKDLGITDSFYLLVTYSETFETGYNAIHFTTAENLNDPDGGDTAAYWHVNNTYSYTQYTVADLTLGTYTVDPDEPEDTY
ncbi:MAG: hypothetical protein J1E00_06815, partial [Oscillospiraceae bacterium]|nr:hypothetical protein [Oscillospiraceae bacterium]